MRGNKDGQNVAPYALSEESARHYGDRWPLKRLRYIKLANSRPHITYDRKRPTEYTNDQIIQL